MNTLPILTAALLLTGAASAQVLTADRSEVAAAFGGTQYFAVGGNPTVDDYIAHVEHLIGVVGIDHVGIATDSYLDGEMVNNRGSADGILDSPRRWYEVARRLARKGYSEPELKKLFGLNFLRVYRTVFK
jgi:microsomal dipeptidase-like Zn-dependent dipeptidase